MFFSNCQDPKPKWSFKPDTLTPFDTIETNSLVINNEDNSLIAGCGDGKIHVWDLTSGDKKQTLEGHTDYIHAVTLLQKDNQIVSAGEDGVVKFWDSRCGDSLSANTGQIEPNKLEMARRSTVGAWVSCLDISPSEDWLVSIYNNHGAFKITFHFKSTRVNPSRRVILAFIS